MKYLLNQWFLKKILLQQLPSIVNFLDKRLQYNVTVSLVGGKGYFYFYKIRTSLTHVEKLIYVGKILKHFIHSTCLLNLGSKTFFKLSTWFT